MKKLLLNRRGYKKPCDCYMCARPQWVAYSSGDGWLVRVNDGVVPSEVMRMTSKELHHHFVIVPAGVALTGRRKRR